MSKYHILNPGDIHVADDLLDRGRVFAGMNATDQAFEFTKTLLPYSAPYHSSARLCMPDIGREFGPPSTIIVGSDNGRAKYIVIDAVWDYWHGSVYFKDELVAVRFAFLFPELFEAA